MRFDMFFEKLFSDKVIRIYSACYACLLVFAFILGLLPSFFPSSYRIGVADLFINYHGGFVRRGLIGEILLWLHDVGGIHPFVSVGLFFFITSLYVTVWIFRGFRQRGYDRFILLSCLCCGSMGIYYMPFMRRVYLLIVLTVALDLMVSKAHQYAWLVFANVAGMLALLTYEPAFFIFGPLFLLIAKVRHSLTWLKAGFSILPMVIIFFITSAYKGNVETMRIIIDSVEPYQLDSHLLNFIGFTTLDVLRIHFDLQYLSAPLGVPAVLVNAFALLFVLYVSTNILSVMGENKIDGEKHKALFRLVFFQMLMQAPMLLILSTDYGRTCFFIVMSSYICLVTLPANVMLNLFPSWFCRVSDSIQQKMNTIMIPTRNKLILMILFIGVPSWHGHIGQMLGFSEIGSIVKIAYDIITYFNSFLC